MKGNTMQTTEKNMFSNLEFNKETIENLKDIPYLQKHVIRMCKELDEGKSFLSEDCGTLEEYAGMIRETLEDCKNIKDEDDSNFLENFCNRAVEIQKNADIIYQCLLKNAVV
jgi:hypothetical protein